MYACTYVCMYHACMYVCMYVCMYLCMHACMRVCMHVCMYVCMRACMHASGLPVYCSPCAVRLSLGLSLGLSRTHSLALARALSYKSFHNPRPALIGSSDGLRSGCNAAITQTSTHWRGFTPALSTSTRRHIIQSPVPPSPAQTSGWAVAARTLERWG